MRSITLQQNFKSQTETISSSVELEAVINDPKVYRKICMIREKLQTGKEEEKAVAEEIKKTLPGLIFMADNFSESLNKEGKLGKWRLQKTAHLNGLVVLDADHLKEDPAEIFSKWDIKKLRELGVYMVFITSSRAGLKIVFEGRTEWGNIIENAREMARILGLTADESGKDSSRMAFAPSREAGDILFLDTDGLFGKENPAFDKRFGDAYRREESSSSLPMVIVTDSEKDAGSGGQISENRDQISKGGGQVSEAGDQVSEAGGQVSEAGEISVKTGCNDSDTQTKNAGVREFRISDYSYKGIPLQKIIDCWIGNEEPQPGERHKTSLILADHLRYITDSDATIIEGALRSQPWVQAIVRERNENVAQTVKSAMGYRENQRLPKRLLEAIRKSGASDPSKNEYGALPYQEWVEKLKKIQLGCYGPATAYIDNDLSKMAGIITSAGMYDTLMTKCWYTNFNGEQQRLNCLNIIVGKPATGKGFAVEQDDNIMEIMRMADEPGRAAERQYKEAIKERGTSAKEQKKEALKKPQAIVRYCPVKTSNNVLYHRLQNAVTTLPDGSSYYLHLYTFASELLSVVNASGSFQEKRDFYLHSFHNERNGVDYANGDSVNDTMPVHYNLVATGTKTSLNKFVNASNIGDGLATRITSFVMPEIGFKMRPLAKKVKDLTAANEMKKWARRFDELEGEIKGLERLRNHVYTIVATRAEEADNEGDEVTRIMCMRMQDKVMALCIPLVLSTQKSWDEVKASMTVKISKQHLAFASLVFDVLLRCEDQLFGQLWQDYYDNEQRDCQSRRVYDKTSEYFRRLPTEFTTQDVMNIWGYTSNTTASARCKSLCESGKIKKAGYGRFIKLVTAV